jgi:hypothetical protein
MRHDLKKPIRRGAPRKPSYVMSETDVTLSAAAGAVDKLRKKNKAMSLNEAVIEIARQRNIPASKLTEHYAGRRRSLRKRK